MNAVIPNLKSQLSYAMYRIVIGALIGFSASLALGYLWTCYNNDFSFGIGLYIFRYPLIGLGILVIGFIGAVIGAIFSLFSKKWNERKL